MSGMRIVVKLPEDRTLEGQLWVTGDDGAITFGPVRCRGKADRREAAIHDNPEQESTLPFGDHPDGVYRVTAVNDVAPDEPKKRMHYGPAFIGLDPIGGDAQKGEDRGRSGLGIHGGLLLPDGSLRATYGCLRVDDETVEQLARLTREAIRTGPVFYRCEPA